LIPAAVTSELPRAERAVRATIGVSFRVCAHIAGVDKRAVSGGMTVSREMARIGDGVFGKLCAGDLQHTRRDTYDGDADRVVAKGTREEPDDGSLSGAAFARRALVLARRSVVSATSFCPPLRNAGGVGDRRIIEA